MKLMDVAAMENNIVQRSPSHHTSDPSSILSTSWARSDEQISLLVENVPKPPLGFVFSNKQRQQQTQFFKLLKVHIIPPDNIDLYKADIVAICRCIFFYGK